jgi:NAD(P)-dependent dehydrogenase (short-subunit alcohol dehydrogenase family)
MPRKTSVKPSSKNSSSGNNGPKKRAEVHEFPSRSTTTGPAQAFGRAVAVLYAREKADVVIIYLPQEQSDAEQTRDAVQEHGRGCLLIPGDVTDPEFCQRALVASDYEPQETAQHGANTPMKRAGQPEEVAPAYVFFASEGDSSYITGEVLTLLGGRTTAG